MPDRLTTGLLCTLTLVLSPFAALAQDDAAADDVATEADASLPGEVVEDASYALGLSFATNLAQQGVEIDLGRFAAGMRAGFGQAETEMTPEEVQAAIEAMQQALARRARAAAEAMASEGEAFLEANAAREGVTETDSGLQYEVLRAGDGASPAATDEVTVHYEGRLIDETVFDSSYERGEPATFPLGAVIPGWTEGLQLMKEGAKFRFFIPSNLAYGKAGSPRGGIGPDQMLIFDVELIEVGGEAGAGG